MPPCGASCLTSSLFERMIVIGSCREPRLNVSSPAVRTNGTLAALALAGCGREEPAATPERAAAGTSVAITATVNESGFRPDTWTVPAGRDVTLTLENAGSEAHSWTVLADRVATQDDLLHYIDQEGAVLAETGNVAPGQSRSVTFRIDDPASYQVVCTVPGHFAVGTQGTLVVK